MQVGSRQLLRDVIKSSRHWVFDKEEIVVPSGYRELKAGEVDAAQEKHVPQVSVEDNKIKVVVGSVEHPMLEAHYITNIWVEYSDGTVDRAGLVPGMKPEYVFDSKGRTGKVIVYEYCNLHGLWKNEIEL